MSTPTKLTAEGRVLSALEAEGWKNITTGQATFRKKSANKVSAEGIYDAYYRGRPLVLTIFFAETGSYLGREIKASGVDFTGYRTTLAGVMDGIGEWSPVNQKRRADARAAEALDQKAAERRKAAEEVATWKAEVDQFKRDLQAQLAPGEAAALLVSGLFDTYVHLTAQVSVVKWANAGVERSELVAYLLDPSGLDSLNVRV